MNRIRIKFCGMTNSEDALLAAELGVDAIGLIFVPSSPRAVDIPAAQQIISRLPPFVSKIGVVANQQPKEIEHILAHVRLDGLQFHGDETPLDCERYDVPYIKVISMKSDVRLDSYFANYIRASGFLVDAYHPHKLGGSGTQIDLSALPAQWPKPWVLAGGLAPGNVAEAISQCKPYAVDVVSGIEASKGRKDANKMRQFVANVNKTVEMR